MPKAMRVRGQHICGDTNARTGPIAVRSNLGAPPPEVAAEAMRAYAEETNRLNRERRSNGDAWKAKLVKVEKQIRGIIEAVKA